MILRANAAPAGVFVALAMAMARCCLMDSLLSIPFLIVLLAANASNAS